jgi:DNA ligase-1
MRLFAALYEQLDASTATGDKLAALARYYAAAPAHDAAWATYFLAGGKPRQVVPTALLRALACQRAGIDDWLFDACYQAVGDLAETIAHVLPPGRGCSSAGLAEWVEQRLLTWRGLAPADQAERVGAAWDELDTAGRFLLVKLIGGGFRVGVSKLLVQRALAAHAGLDPKLLAQRMMGYTEARATPSAARFQALLSHAAQPAQEAGQPYPFFLAHALQAEPSAFGATLGPVDDWQVEWKYDGIRAQVVKRAGQVWIWSRGEELVTERFPEIVARTQPLPDGTVLDGEVLVWHEGQPDPAPFHLLQQRIGRKTLGRKVLADAPVVFIAYDLLEAAGHDLRQQPLAERRSALEALLQGSALRLSPRLLAADWPAFAVLRAGARERGVEGFMLKERSARYGSGRTKADGTWWKWKLDPLSVDAVLVYAQAGHGRRASVYTDYTFAVWSRPPASAAEAQAVVEAIARKEPAPARDSGALQLLPFAKAYSGLSDEEFKAVDRVVRATTLEKFGPVRSVVPTLVFEIGFEGINHSPRHKSGIAVRFPRMLRLRPDKPLHEADAIGVLQAMLHG